MALNSAIIKPNVILEIEGVSEIFSIGDVYRKLRLDEGHFLDESKRLDSISEDLSAYKLIDVKASALSLSQQLFYDKGYVSSVQSLSLDIIDSDLLLTKLLSPGVIVDDLLSRKAVVYLSYDGAAHPEESHPIIYGVIEGIDSGVGSVKLRVAHPDGLKRQEIFPKISTELTEEFRFRCKNHLGVKYQTQDQASGIVTIKLVAGGVAGSESVSVTNNIITVTIEAGVSKASQITNAINNSQSAVNLVEASTLEDMGDTLQTASEFILDSSTTIKVESTEGFLLPSADLSFKTYVKIGEEIVQYTGITATELTGLTRACFETIGRTSDVETEVSSFYRITGNMKDLALKMMLSGSKALGPVPIQAFRLIDGSTQLENAILFQGVDVALKYGLSVGDLIDIEGADHSENESVSLEVQSIEQNRFGSVVILEGANFTLEEESSAVAYFKSKYNVWPDGLGMTLDQVDVSEHEYYMQYFPSGFFDYDFYLKDTIKADQFIQIEIYRPSGCYAVSKNGRASLSVTMPPLAQENTKTFDETCILNPSTLRIVRSYSENFYNSVVYRYEKDAVEEDFLRGKITLSQKSASRVPNVKNISYNIESNGIRNDLESRTKMTTQSRKLLDRYQYGAEKVANVEVLYSVGYNIDVGDTVIFGSEQLQMSDSTLGSRAFRPRVMEVVNKRLMPTQGKVVFDLLNTAYEVTAKYGTTAPSSLIDAGSTSANINLKRSFSTPELRLENYKWQRYIGEEIQVRDADFTVIGTTIVRGFSDSNPNLMIVNPPLSFSPLENYVVEPIPYKFNTKNKWKDFHVYFNPRVYVDIDSVSPNKVTVASLDVSKFYVGAIIRIHSANFSVDSGGLEYKVVSISGNELTLNEAVSFPVMAGYVLDLIGFSDGIAPYRLL